MPVANLETMKVNVVTVASIVVASFSLYFFLGGMIAVALLEAKIYAVDLDIERDQSVITMYRFQIENNVAAPTAQSRMEALQDKVQLRIAERIVFMERL